MARPHEGPGVIRLLRGDVAWWELDGWQTNMNQQETQHQWDWLWRVQSVPVIGESIPPGFFRQSVQGRPL